MAFDHEDEFGLSSGDEADLLNITSAAEGGKPSLKRKSESELSSVAKRQHGGTASSGALDVANGVLKTYFGMQAFRLKQAEAIGRLLDGGSAVVVFPTGGGKSLCYQVPGLAIKEMDRLADIRQGYGESGITLVVSPLIALMKDQVDALKRKGISAASLDSSKSSEEYMFIVEKMRNGTLDILYCAPERLNNEGFVASMAHVRGGVRLLAVDEAHCISEWGHAFRPDYLKVARFAKEIEAERVVCLTATAAPKVAEDVRKAFDIEEEGVFRTTTYRPNLRLLAKSFNTKNESYPHLVAFLRSHPGPTIIYVTLQRHTEELAAKLKEQKFKVRHFHAGMKTEEKTAVQEAFMASDDTIIVATIAFGMGIDKSNIRNVIHYDAPRSLEGYSQEIGRAGRDGLQSQCLLYLCAEDEHLRESFARGDLPSKQSVSALMREVFDQQPVLTDKGLVLEMNIFSQSRDHDIRPGVLKNIYAQLELRIGLLRETTPKYSTYSYRELRSTTHDKSPAAEAVRSRAKKAKTLTHIDVDAAARLSGVRRMDIVTKLNEWNDRGFIGLRVSGVMNIYRLLGKLPSSPAEQQKIIDELYTELQGREEQDLKRGEVMMNLITKPSCFTRTLAEHFGDSLPNGKQECGHCTWCETHKAVVLIKPPSKRFDYARFHEILAAVPDRDDARYLARVAFGITSPRVTQARLRGNIFGAMEDHDFVALLNAATAACSKANQRSR